MIPWSTFVFPASVAFLVDVASKKIAEDALLNQVLMLTPFLNLQLAYNTGISFSWLPAASAGEAGLLVFITGLLTLVVASLGLWGSHSIERIALGLITGGAAANVIDRMPDGRVTDFIDVHLHGWHFPTFNVADVAITVGALLLGYSVLAGAWAKEASS